MDGLTPQASRAGSDTRADCAPVKRSLRLQMRGRAAVGVCLPLLVALVRKGLVLSVTGLGSAPNQPLLANLRRTSHYSLIIIFSLLGEAVPKLNSD